MSARQCGDCQLCCTLLPVPPLPKPANTRCPHQRFGKGCNVYGKPNMPIPCRLWTCRWLSLPTPELRRPDRCGYVVDVAPDFVRVTDNDTGAEQMRLPVVQVWVDPRRPDAWHDPPLLAYLERINQAALIRQGSHDGFLLMPPAHPANPTPGKWGRAGSNMEAEPEHSMAEILQVVSAQ